MYVPGYIHLYFFYGFGICRKGKRRKELYFSALIRFVQAKFATDYIFVQAKYLFHPPFVQAKSNKKRKPQATAWIAWGKVLFFACFLLRVPIQSSALTLNNVAIYAKADKHCGNNTADDINTAVEGIRANLKCFPKVVLKL